jgi:predicted phosphodiesterase
MKEKLTRSQSLVLDTLSGEATLTYEDIASMTGLSYDGVRGRVSELGKMGYNIERIRDNGTTFLMYKEKSSYRRPNNIKDSIGKKIAAVEDFYGITDFLDTQKQKKKVSKIPLQKNYDGDDNAVLLLSDLHFGELIYSQLDGSLVYDTETAEARMDDLAHEVILKLKQENIYHLFLLGIGDIVDGDSIYRNHLFRVEKPAIEQVQDSVKSIVSFIRKVVANDITVEMHNVRGNHGITNYNNLEEDNWDSVVYDMLDLVFAEDDKVTINNFKNSEGVVEVGDRQIVLYHGQKFGPQIKTASGLREFRGMCAKHGLINGDMIVVGHLHEFGVEIDQGKFLVRNGSLADASEYAFKLNLYSEPMQTLMIVNDFETYPRFIPINLE